MADEESMSVEYLQRAYSVMESSRLRRGYAEQKNHALNAPHRGADGNVNDSLVGRCKLLALLALELEKRAPDDKSKAEFAQEYAWARSYLSWVIQGDEVPEAGDALDREFEQAQAGWSTPPSE